MSTTVNPISSQEEAIEKLKFPILVTQIETDHNKLGLVTEIVEEYIDIDSLFDSKYFSEYQRLTDILFGLETDQTLLKEAILTLNLTYDTDLDSQKRKLKSKHRIRLNFTAFRKKYPTMIEYLQARLTKSKTDTSIIARINS